MAMRRGGVASEHRQKHGHLAVLVLCLDRRIDGGCSSAFGLQVHGSASRSGQPWASGEEFVRIDGPEVVQRCCVHLLALRPLLCPLACNTGHNAKARVEPEVQKSGVEMRILV